MRDPRYLRPRFHFHLINDVFTAVVVCVAGGLFGEKMNGEAAKARANDRRNIFLSICGFDNLKPPAM